MFAKACLQNREAVYGLLAKTQVSPETVNTCTGSAFMVAPGILITAAHCLHVENLPDKPLHQSVELIRAPDIGQKMEAASILAANDVFDVGILRIEKPRSTRTLKLTTEEILRGTRVGSLGFPLATVTVLDGMLNVNLFERFQGASISAMHSEIYNEKGEFREIIETDSLMYKGSSGCPGFLESGEVFALHNQSVIDPATAASGNLATRLAISRWVPAKVILACLKANGINV